MSVSFRKLLIALSISTVLYANIAYSNGLTVANASLAQNDTLVLSAVFDTPVQGDLYLATLLPNTTSLLFITESVGITTEAIPYRTNTLFSGNYSLLSIPVLGLTAGNYPLYELTVKTGTSPYDVNNWLEGIDGLHVTTVVVLSTSSSTTTTTTDDIAAGKTLYVDNCQSCHGTRYSDASSASKTRRAINANDGGMKYLSFLTDAELTSIANYMTSVISGSR
ncbi:c-type cytochrome [Beggiatoa leptomitoformis]|uniref:Cytochrome c domain-containing protein n=1 Tax=Beggiatoa leptomitoformis TaxID=288004 RepID=A0A2N9YDT0_9GAMM|nr:cytochrome c [Beggiatoa leptomitoformis]ALG68968.1 hypothetical protein AL038_16310 [Beggiatoa leptomitoformis]AUI68642.1 hypothetical protein BLE401_07935 [Beggiatoa leptomitoformis]